MDLQIQVAGEINRPQISLAPAAFEAKRVALQAAQAIQEVTDFASLEAAAKALTTVKGLTKAVEDSRKVVKKPVLDAGREIDDIARDFCSSLEVEAERLALIVGAYQEAERRKTERVRQEAMEREQQALAEMRAREALRIQEAGDREAIVQDLDAIHAETADKIAALRTDLANAEGPKPEGLMARKTWKFEVTDINALFKSHPELCVISHNSTAIRAIIKNKQDIPGLRVWSETAAVVRSISASLPALAEAYDY